MKNSNSNSNINNKNNNESEKIKKELKEKENTIEILKKEINSLKRIKPSENLNTNTNINNLNMNTYNNFNVKSLQVKKQAQLVYSGGQFMNDGSHTEFASNQKKMLKKISEEQKKKTIRLKKIKSNKE